MIIALCDLLPIVGLEVGMAISDAAGCNWVSYYATLSTHTFQDALPHEVLEMYTEVDFDVKCLMTNPVIKQWIVVLPDMASSHKKYSYTSQAIIFKEFKTEF
jgi:hypothetical protein